MSPDSLLEAKKNAAHTAAPVRSLPEPRSFELPRGPENSPASTSAGHDFGRLSIYAPPVAAGNCPMTLASPRACPFGGVCHTCPARVRAKLAVNRPGDAYEQEADRVAEAITGVTEIPRIQRKCTRCSDDSDEEVRRKETLNHESDPELSPEMLVGIQGILRSPGQTLDQNVRTRMESHLGQDFADVRLHTDAKAAQSARAVNALAYTVGGDIVFGAGQYAPATQLGQKLLAHELTHVVQQRATPARSSAPVIQRQGGGAAGGGAAGGAAAATEHRFTSNGVSVVVRQSCQPANFGFATVPAATEDALNMIFNTECIEESRRTRIQRNLTAHGLDIRCRRSAAIGGACAESTGYYIPANIFTLGSKSFPGHPDVSPGCLPLESTILHEIVHLTRGFAEESLPSSCEASCYGAGAGDPSLCRDIDVRGRRRAAP